MYGLEDPAQLRAKLRSSQKPNIRDGEAEFTTGEEDKERQGKYEAIIDLLLAAGYFRVRIAGLSPFDKVIGGLAWCISSSQVDVDIDLFFQEEANIKLQIKLGEVIEKTLVRMKCPHPLQAFQIRGLDYLYIFPVVQWLVKKVIETRAETGDLLRVVSEWNFGRKYKHPTDVEFEERKPTASEYMKSLNYRYRPSRSLRSKGLSFAEEEDQVQATLLEYGHKAYREVRQEAPKRELSDKAKLLEASLGGAPQSPQEKVDQKQQDDRRFDSMLKNMEATSGGVSNQAIIGLVGMQIDDISRMEGQMGGKDGQQNIPSGMSAKSFEEEQHKRHLENLQKQIEALKQKLLSLKDPHTDLSSQLRELDSELKEKAGRNDFIVQKLTKYDEMVNDDNRADIEILRSLVLLNENLRKQEEQFRENCKRELGLWKERIQKLTESDPGVLDTDRDVLIRETYEKDLQRLIEHRQGLGKKIRDIAMVERKIDEIPSRSELQQYQLQLVECYEQIAVKLTETKKYFHNYNTLNETLKLLTKEISLINSINDIYKQAMKSPSTKAKFLEQMEGIVTSVDSNISRSDQKINENKTALHDLNQKHKAILEKERAYHKAVKEFELECAKNEQLLSKLDR